MYKLVLGNPFYLWPNLIFDFMYSLLFYGAYNVYELDSNYIPTGFQHVSKHYVSWIDSILPLMSFCRGLQPPIDIDQQCKKYFFGNTHTQ